MLRSLIMVVALSGLALTPAFGQILVIPDATESATAATYSDSELESFAVAALEVQRINDDFAPRVQAASTPEEQQELAESATKKMVRAVEEKGLSVGKYEEILSQAHTNPEVAERVVQHLRNKIPQ